MAQVMAQFEQPTRAEIARLLELLLVPCKVTGPEEATTPGTVTVYLNDPDLWGSKRFITHLTNRGHHFERVTDKVVVIHEMRWS